MSRKELLVININYGRDNQILNMKSVNLTPGMASELVKTISVLVCGYPELDSLEQPENIKSPPLNTESKKGQNDV